MLPQIIPPATLPTTLLCLAAFAPLTLLQAQTNSPKPLPELAFPTAEGFGALATGGRGGEIYHVTNLNDAGPGSFRDAVSQGKRLVIFDVGGVIKLAANVSVNSDLTLAGQSAPGDGIVIYGHSVSFSGETNLIVRHLRFREGIAGDRGKCSVNLSDGSHMIFDHCSIQWGRWDNLGVTQGSHDITFQNCLIGEGIDPQRFGALVDSVTNITDLDRDGTLNGRVVVEKAFGDGEGAPTFVAQPLLIPPVPMKIDGAAAAYQKVMKSAGASLHRDSVDARLIAELTSLGKLGKISHNETEAGGLGEIKSGKPLVDATKYPNAIALEKHLNELAGD